MRHANPRLAVALMAGMIAASALATPAAAQLFRSARAAPVKAIGPDQVATVRRALDEQRFLDAGRMIDQMSAVAAGDPQLSLLTGELALRRGMNEAAVKEFAKAEASPATSAAALEGRGIALARLNRTDEAVVVLKQAVAQDPAAWRAWNALGAAHDARREWADAEAAYERALTPSVQGAIVLNNRGYSRLLQRRLPEATADFVAALARRPDFTEARTNLRLAMALEGQYDRSIAGVSGAERATQLNNVGFAAAMRGDYGKAQEYLQQALEARGEYYDRAAENLKIVQSLDSSAGAAK